MRISDWSSDVCSSDLLGAATPGAYVLVIEAAREVGGRELLRIPFRWPAQAGAGGRAAGKTELGAVSLDRKSVVSGKSVSVRVDLGGRRIITKKTQHIRSPHYNMPLQNIIADTK